MSHFAMSGKPRECFFTTPPSHSRVQLADVRCRRRQYEGVSCSLSLPLARPATGDRARLRNNRSQKYPGPRREIVRPHEWVHTRAANTHMHFGGADRFRFVWCEMSSSTSSFVGVSRWRRLCVWVFVFVLQPVSLRWICEELGFVGTFAILAPCHTEQRATAFSHLRTTCATHVIIYCCCCMTMWMGGALVLVLRLEETQCILRRCRCCGCRCRKFGVEMFLQRPVWWWRMVWRCGVRRHGVACITATVTRCASVLSAPKYVARFAPATERARRANSAVSPLSRKRFMLVYGVKWFSGFYTASWLCDSVGLLMFYGTVVETFTRASVWEHGGEGLRLTHFRTPPRYYMRVVLCSVVYLCIRRDGRRGWMRPSDVIFAKCLRR